MAVFNEPAQWDHTLGNNADTSTLPDDAAATAGIASLQKLFQLINATPLEAGGIAPDREDVNALFKYLGDSIFYAMNGGVPSYNADYDYIVGRVVLYNGNLYKCIQANGVSSTVVTPDSNTAYWQRLDVELYDYIIESVENSDGSWYRKWKSGWIEQGGCVGNDTDTHILNTLVSFLMPFSEYNYTITGSVLQTDEYSSSTVYIGLDTAVERSPFFCNRDKTHFKIASMGPNKTVSWYACGMGV